MNEQTKHSDGLTAKMDHLIGEQKKPPEPLSEMQQLIGTMAQQVAAINRLAGAIEEMLQEEAAEVSGEEGVGYLNRRKQ